MVLICGSLSGQAQQPVTSDTLPAVIKGHFIDDYGIRYHITDSVWMQLPNSKYHIISYNPSQKYILARNDDKNSTDAGLFTRIDVVEFDNMPPFLWGFCLAVYNATSLANAMDGEKTDRTQPKKGCNGFPFSRMKRTK
ncbi:MAG: hypothetical protein EAY75_05760 [Bacteroidetes bacterium]|nr:MAG: hypothetical protein EAY75_05760 [Bacteroidota bacterium]